MGAFHDFFYEFLQAREFFLGRFEEKLVMNLEHHARFEAVGELAVEFNHGQLDEVGGGALHGRVHGGAFGEIAETGLGRVDLRNRADTAEKIARDASLACFGNLFIEERFYARVAFEVGGDEFGGFFLLDAELLSQTEGREAVHHAEVNHFCDAAVFARLRERADAEDLCRGTGVDVFARAECLHEDWVF